MQEVTLTIYTPEGTTNVPMSGDRLLIGRTDAAGLCLDDPGLSRLHASINRDGERVWLLDEGSTNGTHVNGMAVPAVGKPLADGDKIDMGDYTTIWVSMRGGTAGVKKLEVASGVSLMSRLKLVASIVLVFGLVAGLGWLVIKLSANGRIAVNGNIEPSRPDNNNAVTNANTNPNIEDTTSHSSSVDVPRLANKLTFEILGKNFDGSGKDWYVFDKEFVAQIKGHIDEYRDVNIDEDPCRDIAESFGTHQGMPVILGLVMAMSQSKFKDVPTDQTGTLKEVGLLRLPSQIVEGYRRPGETDASVRGSKRSAGISAKYTKALVNLFGGMENFMYVIACFGMRLDEAAGVQRQVLQLDPATRKDFWKVAQSRAVSQEAANRVARFFAAGIVGENPQEFHPGARPLSSLF